MPVRLKGMHFINSVWFMDKLLTLIRPFIKKGIEFGVHTTIDSLLKVVGIEQLPNEYGGKAGTLMELKGKKYINFTKLFALTLLLTEKTYTHIQDNRQFFFREESMRRVNETLRSVKGTGTRKMS